MDVQNLLFLFAINAAINMFFKGRTFEKISNSYTVFLTGSFLFGSTILFLYSRDRKILSFDYFPLFSAVTLLWFLWPWIIRKIGTYPQTYISQQPMRFFAKFDPRISWIKFGEILLQQSSFFFLFSNVLQLTPLGNKYLMGMLIIGGMHLVNYFFMPARWATFYFLLSVPMSLVFGYLIVHQQLFLTASIHILFYIIHNSYYWFPGKKYLK